VGTPERPTYLLEADFFFAHPYASWERGANENMNGLIRQFFPKKMSFDSITPEGITFAVNKLNHRPRKCLGFRTPHEVFMAQLQSQQKRRCTSVLNPPLDDRPRFAIY
jgi:IS30 family transposase